MMTKSVKLPDKPLGFWIDKQVLKRIATGDYCLRSNRVRCEHCQSWINSEDDKCLNCTAPNSLKKVKMAEVFND